CYRGDFNNKVCSITSDCTNTACTAAGAPLPCCTGFMTGSCAAGQCAQFLANISIDLNPPTTGTVSLTGTVANTACTGVQKPIGCCTGAGTGTCTVFCPRQSSNFAGAFRTDVCQSGAHSGESCTAATAMADCGAGVSCRPGNIANYCVGGTADG